MGGSTFVPILIAGLIGLLIGWWSGPDIDTSAERIREEVAALRAPLEEVRDGLSELTRETAGAEADTALRDAVAAVNAQLSDLAGAMRAQGGDVADDVRDEASEADMARSNDAPKAEPANGNEDR